MRTSWPERYAPRRQPTIRRTQAQMRADRMAEFDHFLTEQRLRVLAVMQQFDARQREREMDDSPYLRVDMTLREVRS